MESIQAELVEVECIINRGIPDFSVEGLASGHGKQTESRIKTALIHSGLHLPYLSIKVHLAPVDVMKRGGQFDLAIALAVMIALGALKSRQQINYDDCLIVGELSLSGSLRPLRSGLAYAYAAKRNGFGSILIPECTGDLSLVSSLSGIRVITVKHLSDIFEQTFRIAAPQTFPGNTRGEPEDFCMPVEVTRAASIAVAGHHSILFVGPPGCGKSTLVRQIPDYLSPLDEDESFEVMNVSSLVGEPIRLPVERPIRAPHHTVTAKGLVGGGIPIVPGEVTLAHQGTLILDELAEFQRMALQSLREPMQEKQIRISRAGTNLLLPAKFLFLATSNPCPCGYFGFGPCRCESTVRRNYIGRILGPLRDRIEIECIVNPEGEMSNLKNEWENIRLAQERQEKRFTNTSSKYNSEIERNAIDLYCHLEEPILILFQETVRSRNLSHRRSTAIRRLARTIADLNDSAEIREQHLLEAFSQQTIDEYYTEDLNEIRNVKAP